MTTEHRNELGFSPVRGFARAVVAHAGYTIDVNRSVAFEAVVRQNGQGVYAKAAGLALLRGNAADFPGQYHAIPTLRHSFELRWDRPSLCVVCRASLKHVIDRRQKTIVYPTSPR